MSFVRHAYSFIIFFDMQNMVIYIPFRIRTHDVICQIIVYFSLCRNSRASESIFNVATIFRLVWYSILLLFYGTFEDKQRSEEIEKRQKDKKQRFVTIKRLLLKKQSTPDISLAFEYFSLKGEECVKVCIQLLLKRL